MGETLAQETIRPSFDELVADFCEAFDRGVAVDRRAWIDRHPEHAGELSRFFADHDLLLGLVTPLKEAIGTAGSATSVGFVATESFGETEGPPRSSTEPPPTLYPPRVGDYELIRRLGRGAMGDVYEARQARLNRVVALKMIRAGLLATDEDVKRFRNEAEAVALLDHPRIVTIHAVGEDQGLHYFSMRLIRGGNLAERVEAFRKDPRAAASLMIEVARAIQYAHQQGILHRDLKPANILIDENDQPCVGDFGLAKRVGVGSDLTSTGAILGTPSYMAPEQADGNKGRVTTLTDVYGLGAVLYALLTGRAPFVGGSVLETIEQVRSAQSPELPSRINPKVSRDLETICLKCLEKDPRRRYASAEHLADDLRRWLDGEPISARPVSRGARAWMWCRRNRTIAAFLIAVSLFAGLSSWQWLRAERLLHQAERNASGVEIDQALSQCSQGEVGRGLLQLAETLRTAPSGSEDLKQAIRANIVAWAPRATQLKAVLPRENQVYLVAYSSDGTTILTVNSGAENFNLKRPLGGAAQLWSAETGKPLGGPLSHEVAVQSAAFSPDGQMLATCGNDGTARLWRVADGAPLGKPLRHEGAVLSVAFSPDGQILLTGSTSWTAQFWDVRSGTPLGEPLKHANWVFQVGFRPDGRVAMTACHDGRVRLWDVRTREMISEKPQIHGDQSDHRPVRLAAFGGDGTRIITNRMPGTPQEHGAQLWDGATGEAIGPALRHEREVRAVALSRDVRLALTGGDDKSARLWDARTGLPFGPPLRHQETVRSVALSGDATLALTGTEDGTVQLWSVATGKPLGDPMRHRGAILDMAFHPSTREIVTASEEGAARIWTLAPAAEPSGARVTETEAGMGDQPAYLAYSPDGKRMLVGHPDGTARVRDADTMIEAGVTLKHEHEVLSVAWSPDGQRLLTGCADGTVRLWWAESGMPIKPVMAHQGPARSVAFSSDGLMLLTGGEDRTARLWDAGTGKPIGPPRVHDANVIAVAFHPDGRTLLTRTDDEVVRRWDRPMVTPGSDERFLIWVPLVTGGTIDADGSIRGFDAETWQRYQARLEELGGAPGAVSSLVNGSGLQAKP